MRLNEYLKYWSLKALKSVSVTFYKLQMIEIKSETKVKDWVEDQIWISSETLWLCQDII